MSYRINEDYLLLDPPSWDFRGRKKLLNKNFAKKKIEMKYFVQKFDKIKLLPKKNNLLQKYFGLKKQQNLTKATVVYVKPQGTTFDEMPQLVSKYCYGSTIAICRQALRQRDILAI